MKANWDIFKIYGVINDTKYPNYDQTLRCCFLFNSNGSQKIIEMKPTDKQQFWDPASLRSFHVTCPNPKHGMKKVPDGVAITILGVPCRSGYVTYMTPSYPLRPAGTTLALGTKIAHGNVSAEMIIEWMETYKFLGVDKVVTYYADGLCPLALQVLKYYAKEGILDLRFFEPAGAGKPVPQVTCCICTLVNVYVDLVVFTRIAGTSKSGSGRYWCEYYIEKHAICLNDYRIRSFLSIQYVYGNLCKHLGIDSSTDHPDRYSNLFLNAYINRNVHAENLKMI